MKSVKLGNSAADEADACAPPSAEDLANLGNFFERMKKLGAAGVRIGNVAIQFAPAPMAIPKRRAGSDDETLYHSAG